MAKLVQAAIVFFHGLREHNQARNSLFATLLAINQAIAGQMELTRQTLEHAQEHGLTDQGEGDAPNSPHTLF